MYEDACMHAGEVIMLAAHAKVLWVSKNSRNQADSATVGGIPINPVVVYD